jgi:hypothetical protein
MNEKNELINYLKEYVLRYSMTDWVYKYIKTTKDISNHRYSLIRLKSSGKIVDYVATIILKDIMENKRFRKIDCLRVLKNLKNNVSSYTEINPITIKKLFVIYKQLIFSQSDTLKWSVSSLMKNLPMDEKAIDWLIENYSSSEHILNRLLLYPLYNKKIYSWAEMMYKSNQHEKRLLDIIALLIYKDVPSFINNVDSNIILWAIYKSRVADSKKIFLLKKYSDINNISSVFEISDRLETPDIAKYILNQIKKHS